VLAVVILASTFTVFPPLHAVCPARAVFSFHFEGWLSLVLVGFIGSSLLIERFSCKYLCPLGGILAITNRFAPLRLVVGENKCNACGRCEKDCTMDIDPLKAEHDPECIRCLECLETCARPEGMDLKFL